jgi:3-hydroxy-3-methylglutaryl CoA synthase
MEIFTKIDLPYIEYSKQILGTYGGSVFIALLATINQASDLLAGDRLGVFSYGSGSCAEFYGVAVTEKSKEVAAKSGIEELLKNRYVINVQEYEAMEMARETRIKEGDFTPDFDMVEGLYENAYEGKGLLIYKGSKGYYREYGLS